MDPSQLSQVLAFSYALLSPESASLNLPDFPADNLTVAAQIMEKFPTLPPYFALYRLYPYESFLTKEGRQAVEDTLSNFNLLPSSKERNPRVKLQEVAQKEDSVHMSFSCHGLTVNATLPCGSNPLAKMKPGYVETSYQETLLAELLQSHIVKDICLIGSRGCGKSATVQRLADVMGYQIEPVVLYQDMTSRDLIQQRNTLPNGDTIWQDSQLVMAACEGKLAVLDGIHRIHASTLAVIHRLVHDRELQLYDGKRLVRHDRYDEIKSSYGLTDEDMKNSGVFRIHPSFRIIALAEPPAIGGSTGQWLSAEMLSLFLYHHMRPLSIKEELHIIKRLYRDVHPTIHKIVQLAHILRESEDKTIQSIAGSLSTRQLLRIARRVASYPTDDAYNIVQRACLARFLPTTAQQALETALHNAGISNTHSQKQTSDLPPLCTVDETSVQIGKTKAPRYKTDTKTKVPDVLFFDIPQHVSLLEWLLQDFQIGEHLLLVGNQGVGKNKLVDRLLFLINRPREYIQLHRDTTVQTLTLQPTVLEGVVVYEDSPLIRAVKLGHVLVVDEADKAPTHVTCILKTLVESGEMILSDGRRIVPSGDPRASAQLDSIIPMHPEFRMIVLANRPGFPFLGNDFFGALGDLFSCHAVDNPSEESEIALLKSYGPDVPEKTLTKLVKAFGELRSLADQGLVAYPYSTREVVNIVKHLQQFPDEGLASVVRNVFDFDAYSQEVQDMLRRTLHKHGIPVGVKASNVSLGKEFPLPGVQMVGRWQVIHQSNFHDKKPLKIAVEERYFKMKGPMKISETSLLLDRVDARGAFFSEMQSYWSIPVTESNIIAEVAVSKGPINDSLSDTIYILTSNPVSLFSMIPLEDKMKVHQLQEFLPSYQGFYPDFTMAALGGKLNDCIVIHSGSSNKLLVVDTAAGELNQVCLSSVLEQAASKLSRTFHQTANKKWKLKTDFMENNWGVLYEVKGDKLEVINFETWTAYTLTLPFNLNSVQLVAQDKWLLEDTNNKKHLLEKSNSKDPCPNVLYVIEETCGGVERVLVSHVLKSDSGDLSKSVLSSAIREQINAPNRLMVTSDTFATVIVGFPDLERSENYVYKWPRQPSDDGLYEEKHHPAVDGGQNLIILRDSGQVVKAIPSWKVPEEVASNKKLKSGISGYLEVTDLISQKLRFIKIPEPAFVSPYTSWLYSTSEIPVHIAETSNGGLVSVDAGGCIRLWETATATLQQSFEEWQRMIDSTTRDLQVTIEQPSGKDVSEPKFGKIDETGAPHVGGNTWAGGTGGRDTAGLGGKGGPFRLDGGHTVYQVSQEEKDAVPEHVKKAAREMAEKAFKERLREIKMSEYDAGLYEQYFQPVSRQVNALRVILSSLQAKAKERQWLRHQTSGELDDTKLIEGITGERTIYRRRTEQEPEMGAPQQKPKRLKVVVDVSGSMYRFNGYDGRLDREMEAVILVMEAFEGYENKFQYDIVGHSGESYNLEFVDHKSIPANKKERLDIVKTMHAHSQFCISGDYTLQATHHAINTLAQEDCDEAFVVVLSDANLERYGIPPERFGQALTSDDKVNAYAIFIGSLGDQAARLTEKLPSGRAFVCLDLKDIPQIMQQIFTSSILSSR